MKKKNYLIISGIILIVIIIGVIIWYGISAGSKNFIKLNYNEFKEKVDNNDSFVLCVSRTTCSHCNDYKPKLKEVSKKYNIKIYYTEINEFSNSELDYFKDNFGFDGGTPITIFFKDGEEKTTATRIEGDISIERTIDKFKKNGFIK